MERKEDFKYTDKMSIQRDNPIVTGSEVTAEDLMGYIKLVNNGRPTKEKPFVFVKGHCIFNSEDIGAVSFKNDGENITTVYGAEDRKVDHEELFENGIIKFIE